jgi:hypothetical protein
MPEPNRSVPSLPDKRGHSAQLSSRLVLILSRGKLTLIQCAQTLVSTASGPVYNWLAVANSTLMILDHALQYRAAHVTRVGSIRVSQSRERRAHGDVYEKTQEEVEVKDIEEIVPSTAYEPLSSEPTHIQPSSLLYAHETWFRQLEIAATPRTSLSEMAPEHQL